MIKQNILSVLVLGLCGITLWGCGSGDPARGQQLFTGTAPIAAGKLPACTTCHADTVDGRSPLGPNLSNVGNRASNTVPGESAEQYLRTAIVDPDAYLVDGYQEGIMNRNYGKGMTDQEISDLVAYMLTLKSGKD